MTINAQGRSVVPASSLPNPNEELWIISKQPKTAVAAPVNDDEPRSGALVVAKENKLVPCPLKHTDVKARVDGYIASVDVTQQYVNPFSEKIEATYVFPLPENAAVNEFVMVVGDRTIRGIIREREEAKQIYEAARQQGHVASLLQQERPNIFTQKVANIEPGKQIDIQIRYFNTLAYTDGWYEFVFPMVVGPRFNPPGSTDGVGAVGRNNAQASGQKTEVQYLAPTERTGHDISLSVELNAGVKVEEIRSVNHDVETIASSDAVDGTPMRVSLRDQDRIPNKDFVLRFRVGGKTLKSAVVTQRDPRDPQGGGYFAVMLYPPDSAEQIERRPVDLCFTLDVSGSMNGQPIAQSKAAIRAALSMMRTDDTFQIIRFASNADQMSPQPLPATKENVARALQFVENTSAGGGTMMLEGIPRSLNQPTDESRVRYVCMLTDGFIGNENDIIKATRQMHGNTRVFGFGVGSAPNRFLLDGMSRAGAGAVAYLSLNEKGEEIMQPFFERISRPVMTNIQVDTSGLSHAELSVAKVPDLYVGRAVVLTGRYKGDGGALVIRGRVGEQVVERKFDIRASDAKEPGALERPSAIASVWARQKIAALCDDALLNSEIDLGKEVKQVALDFGLMSQFTSFVAVDASRTTAGDHRISVVVPVPVPDGVRYDTTVQTKGDALAGHE